MGWRPPPGGVPHIPPQLTSGSPRGATLICERTIKLGRQVEKSHRLSEPP